MGEVTLLFVIFCAFSTAITALTSQKQYIYIDKGSVPNMGDWCNFKNLAFQCIIFTHFLFPVYSSNTNYDGGYIWIWRRVWITLFRVIMMQCIIIFLPFPSLFYFPSYCSPFQLCYGGVSISADIYFFSHHMNCDTMVIISNDTIGGNIVTNIISSRSWQHH